MANWFDDYEEGINDSKNTKKDAVSKKGALEVKAKPSPVKETILEENTKSIIPDDIDIAMTDDAEKKNDEKPSAKQEDKDVSNTDATYIGSECIIEGDLKVVSPPQALPSADGTNGALTIAGTINGNAEIKGNVILTETGCIKNNLHADGDIVIKGTVGERVEASGLITFTSQSRVHGSVNTGNNIEVDHDSVIIGNMACKNAVIDGAVKGDVSIKENITLKEHAIVKGAIKAASLHISPGAIIDGSCVLTNQTYDAKSIFGE